MNLTISGKLKHYLVFGVAIVLSSIIGYYFNHYTSNVLLTIVLSAVLAIILVQLFELTLSQLKQKNYPVGQYGYSPQTVQVIEQLQAKIFTKLSAAGIADAQFYILHWPTKQYLTWQGATSFPLQHSLVYASQHWQQTIALSDEKYFSQLPEVIALDIKALLKQHQATHAIPLGHGHDVYGFVFVNSQQKQLDSASWDLAKHAGLALEQVLQHEAIVIGSQILPTQPTDRTQQTVPWQSLVVLGLFLILTLYWFISPAISIYTNLGHRFIFDFGCVYGIVALWGGIRGLVVAKQLRRQKNLSFALLMFAIGLLLQVFGQLCYSTYSFVWGVIIPYPSVGDIGFFGSVLFYIAGVLFLAKASGVSLKLQTFKNQLLATIVPLLMLLIGYLLFLQDYQLDLSDPIRVFLDFGYPLFQAVYVSVAILIYLLTRDTAGATKNQVFLIVIALIWQFICDYTYLYQVSRGTWEVNGLNDYMYLVSYVLMSLAVLRFYKKVK